jgi:hypothetical protein
MDTGIIFLMILNNKKNKNSNSYCKTVAKRIKKEGNNKIELSENLKELLRN